MKSCKLQNKEREKITGETRGTLRQKKTCLTLLVHQTASISIHQHQSTLSNTNQCQSTPISINQNQSAKIRINLHQSASIKNYLSVRFTRCILYKVHSLKSIPPDVMQEFLLKTFMCERYGLQDYVHCPNIQPDICTVPIIFGKYTTRYLHCTNNIWQIYNQISCKGGSFR